MQQDSNVYDSSTDLDRLSQISQIKQDTITAVKESGFISDKKINWERVTVLENELVNNPESFSERSLTELGDLLKEFPEYLTKIIKRLFDINEGTILNRSEAEKGFIGRLNRLSRQHRRRKYFRKIDNGFRNKDPKRKVILAEGDSWFEFPIFVRDIIDWLIRDRDYAVYSYAFGGDWLSNILYQGEYIETLPVHIPDVFLISGGGNDLVGDNRLTSMISGEANERAPIPQYLQATGDAEVKEGRRFLLKEFYSFLHVIKIQYFILFTGLNEASIRKPDLKDLLVITQGYDYPIPSRKINWKLNIGFPWIHQPFLNMFTNHGEWLRQSFMLKGILDEETQRKIVRAMIHDFNENMISLVLMKNQSKNDLFPNVCHIDCRELAQRGDWYDELHLRPGVFKKVASLYKKCINELPENRKKVYSKADLPGMEKLPN